MLAYIIIIEEWIFIKRHASSILEKLQSGTARQDTGRRTGGRRINQDPGVKEGGSRHRHLLLPVCIITCLPYDHLRQETNAVPIARLIKK